MIECKQEESVMAPSEHSVVLLFIMKIHVIEFLVNPLKTNTNTLKIGSHNFN